MTKAWKIFGYGVIVAAIFALVIPLASGGEKASAKSTENIEHIFTHELVFDTDKAYSENNKLRGCFDKDHMTTREFSALLDSLYERDYVLVSLDDVIQGSVTVPDGKRPIVLSVDDLTYDTRNRGCIDKIVLKDGEIYDYTQNAEPQFTRERECITILESFISKHPDFSSNGARATLCVNGYNGILGYRITPDCRVSESYRERETEECKSAVAALKKLGYRFASHTYYHKYFNSMTENEVAKDISMWKKYVEPIVGKTRVLCFPAGEHKASSGKIDLYINNGFDVFLCVGSGGTEYEKSRDDCEFIYRKPFDGTSLRLYGDMYSHLVDTRVIYDPRRYLPFSYKGGYYTSG